ncbi:hypothetical protein AVEN_186456-1, partial [Araneus ventricosus]
MLSDGVILLHENTHTAPKTQKLLQKFEWETWSHSPYNPDWAPNMPGRLRRMASRCHRDYFLFPKLKELLSGISFSLGSDVKTENLVP